MALSISNVLILLFCYYSKAAKSIIKNPGNISYAKARSEMDTLKNLNSEYIVKYLGFVEYKNNLYIIMQLYEVY